MISGIDAKANTVWIATTILNSGDYGQVTCLCDTAPGEQSLAGTKENSPPIQGVLPKRPVQREDRISEEANTGRAYQAYD